MTDLERVMGEELTSRRLWASGMTANVPAGFGAYAPCVLHPPVLCMGLPRFNPEPRMDCWPDLEAPGTGGCLLDLLEKAQEWRRVETWTSEGGWTVRCRGPEKTYVEKGVSLGEACSQVLLTVWLPRLP